MKAVLAEQRDRERAKRRAEEKKRIHERYCRCVTVPIGNGSIADRSLCPLHSDDPKYDLPDGI